VKDFTTPPFLGRDEVVGAATPGILGSQIWE